MENVDFVLISHWNSQIPYTGFITVENSLDLWENFSGYHTIINDVTSLF